MKERVIESHNFTFAIFWFYQINNFILNSQNIFLFRKFYCVNKFPEIELKFGKIDKIKMFWIWNLCVEKSVTISHSMIGQKEYRILVEFSIYKDYRRLLQLSRVLTLNSSSRLVWSNQRAEPNTKLLELKLDLVN